MEKVIDFNYRSDEFSGTNQLVAGGDDEKKSGSSRKDAPKLSKKAKKFALRNKSETRGALLSKKERKKLSKIVEMKAKKQSRAELEEELKKFRNSKAAAAALISPVGIFSQNRYEKRRKERSLRVKASEEEKEAESEEEDEDEEEDEEEVDEGTKDVAYSSFSRSEIEAELQKLQQQQPSIARKRPVSPNADEPEPTEKKKKKKKKAKPKIQPDIVLPSSSDDSESDPEPKEDPKPGPKSDEPKPEPDDAAPARLKSFVLIDRPEEVQKAREALPILGEECAVMEAVEANDAVILIGPTGCGKTTQVPQFLFEAGFAAKGKKIGVTEPRRVAAMAMARRVGHELNLSSQEVSYQIRYEGNAGPQTKIKFMTDGVLLQEMKSDINLSSYSAIVVDEAHERSVYTDLVIGILSRVLRRRRRLGLEPLKLIIMSATLDAVSFVENRKLFGASPPPVLELSARQHPISVHHLKRTPQDYLQAAFAKASSLHRSAPLHGGFLIFLTGAQEVQTLCRWLRKAFPGPKSKAAGKEEEEEEGTTKKKDKKRTGTKKDEEESEEKSWLEPIKMENFSTIPLDEESELSATRRPRLAGTEEGREDSDADLSSDSEDDFAEEDRLEVGVCREAAAVHVLPLYSLLPSERQQLVFDPPPEGHRLIVVATNVAETSLTIPNIRYVIDTGRVKEKVFDKVSGVSTFQVGWISQASAKQRAGRAGRTGPGDCFRLYSSQVYEDFEEHPEPEMARRPVEDIVLLLKSFIGKVDVASFPFPTPPPMEALSAAEDRLLDLGALEKDRALGRTQITTEGRLMANLPVSPRFAKILLLSCLQEDRAALPFAVLLVSALSVQQLFQGRADEEEGEGVSERRKFETSFMKVGQSLLLGDFTLLLGASWWVCWQLDKQKRFELDVRAEAERYGLRWKALMEVRKLRRQLTEAVNAVFPEVRLSLGTHLDPPSEAVLLQLRQMLLAASPHHVARKLTLGPDASEKQRRQMKRAYASTLVSSPVFIHPHSQLFREGHEWLVFLELQDNGNRLQMRHVMVVSAEWLPLHLPRKVRVSNPLPDPCPIYHEACDSVLCQAEKAEFGPHGWLLPSGLWVRFPSEQEYRSAGGHSRGRFFARLLMEGKVLPKMEPLSKMWMPSCRPAMITQDWGLCRSQVKDLISALKGVSSKKELLEKFAANPKYLWSEISRWIPASDRPKVESSWPPVDS